VSIALPQATQIADACSHRNRFDANDFADDLEIHARMVEEARLVDQ
jgi:hypothetical protein